MPVAIGGSLRKTIRWYREAILPPLWLQEARTGVKRSSPLIYPMYLLRPLTRVYRALKRRVFRQRLDE